MEADAALVGTDGAIELHTPAVVDVDLALVIHPWHTEADGALRFDDAFKDRVLFILGFLVQHRGQGVKNFGGCLDEKSFPGRALFQALKDFIDVLTHGFS